MAWKCKICGIEHSDLPTCFGMEAPWWELVPEDEFNKRVELTKDQCVIDEKVFFIRGHIEIPVHGHVEPLALSVWSSLSEASFLHVCERWEAPDRADDPPYFGWLSNEIPVYRGTINLKLSVQSRSPGLTPLFTVKTKEHHLAIDQQNGITTERWHELAHQILHAS